MVRRVLFGYSAILALAMLAPVLQPFAFQKINAVERVNEWASLSRETDALDVSAVLGALPYQKGTFWAVDPASRYRGTIEQGLGNCSQKVFGLAYELDRSEIDFQIVHLFPVDTFLLGQGHTLLRTVYDYGDRERVGLVDLLQGGLPASGERFLDVGDLGRGAIPDFRFELIATGGEDASDFYGPGLWELVPGYVPAEEVARYYRFLKAVYVPLGHDKLEKYAYDGLAMLLGFYPRIYVVEFDRLFAGRVLDRAWHRSSLWVLRSGVVMGPLLLVAGARRRRS